LRTAGVTFADARKAQLVLQYETVSTATALGQLVTVKGYTDAAGMHPARDGFFSRVIFDLAFSLILFDWKTPKAMLPANAASVKSQLCCQAIAFRETFGYSVPVVATDLNTAIRVWNLEGDLLVEYESASRGALSLNEGMQLVWHLVRQQLPKVSAWRETKKNRGHHDDTDTTAHHSTAPHDTVLPGDEAGPGGRSDGFCGGGAGGGAMDEMLCGESGEAVAQFSNGIRQTMMSAAEADLYDDLEQEVVAQRIAAVWNNSSSLQGLIAQLATATHV